MLDLLPESVWNSKTRFLDICCKSGNFLIEIYNRLDRILSSDNNFKDPVKRRKHILENQIYGICTDSFEEMMVKRRMLGDPFSDNENISTIAYVHPVSGASKQFRELAQLSKQKTLEKRKEQLGYLKDAIKEKFKQMDFDVVVGNPPYNNDMYLSFVMAGHELAKQFTLMITPAKWQAKGGGQNEEFRKNIVPYMNKIVYYPDERDIFDIGCSGGIAYYLVHKVETKVKYIQNISKLSWIDNSVENRELNGCLNNTGYSIINKLNGYSKLKFGYYAENKKYRFRFSKLFSDRNIHEKNLVLNPPYIEDRDKPQNFSANYPIRFSSDNIDEVKSFISYIYSKFARFLVIVGLCSTEMASDYVWRFVPDPGAFDHIFTDEELYKKYNLTDDEIKLIESVIKERK